MVAFLVAEIVLAKGVDGQYSGFSFGGSVMGPVWVLFCCLCCCPLVARLVDDD